MNDESQNTPPGTRSWLEKIGQAFCSEPRDKNELIEILREAHDKQLIDANAFGMMEGVLEIQELRVRDIMLPRSQMVVIEQNMPLKDILPIVIETVHSRFPVIGENKDEVLGILLAKDLLTYTLPEHIKEHNPLGTRPRHQFNIREILRPAVFVPESKRLDVLLQEFRVNRNHMAVVIDEYGGVTGLVTIEDVLEEIVGDIEDEYDTDDDQVIKKHNENSYYVKALTPIEEFNEYFNANLDDKEAETIGGLVLRGFGHLPKRGESIVIDQYKFKIMRADNRRIHLLHVIPDKSLD
jgi:magnesium and cobalt transporter